MEATGRAGRLIGFLILLQMAGSALVSSVLEAPLFGSPGFLQSASPHAAQLGLAAILGILTEALWVGIAVIAFPALFPRAPSLALWLTALTVAGLAAAVAESAAVMTMVSASRAWVEAAPADRAQIEALRTVVAAARNWPHFLARLLDACVIFTIHATFYRLSLVPRGLAVFGLLTALSMAVSVALPLFGRPVNFGMLAPVGLAQLAVSIWLLARGFRLGPDPVSR